MNVTEETVWMCPDSHVVTDGEGDGYGAVWGPNHDLAPHGVYFRSEQAANDAIGRWVKLLADHVPTHLGMGPGIFLFASDVRKAMPGLLMAEEELLCAHFKLAGIYYPYWEQRVEVVDVIWKSGNRADSGWTVRGRIWYRLQAPRRVQATLPDGEKVWVDPKKPTILTDWLPVRDKIEERTDPSLEPAICSSYAVRAVKHTLRWGS